MTTFDLLGPLPAPGSTTLLEASAGTGKTFALAGLVTRYIAEGVASLDQMLLITFSRSATQELRDRVRRQISQAWVAFDRPESAGENELVRHLLTGTPEVIISCVKAALFGLIAGLVACYRGLMISGGGAKAVGNAVNETVVYAFMALFVVNVVVTAIGIRLTTG